MQISVKCMIRRASGFPGFNRQYRYPGFPERSRVAVRKRIVITTIGSLGDLHPP